MDYSFSRMEIVMFWQDPGSVSSLKLLPVKSIFVYFTVNDSHVLAVLIIINVTRNIE